MKKNTSNRVKATIRLGAIVVLILSCIFFNLCITSNKANADENKGTHDTAKQKLYAQALTECLSSPLLGTVSASDAKTANIFDNGRSIKGAWLEQELKGSASDGLTMCSNENALNKMLSALGISREELFCNGNSAGIFDSSNPTKANCKQIYDGVSNQNGSVWLTPVETTSRVAYAKDLITEKTFGNNTPGMNQDQFTNFEHYYVYFDAFFAACANINSETKDSNLEYQVYRWDSSEGNFVKYGFTQKKGPDSKVYVSKSDGQMKCSEIMDKLNGGDAAAAYFNAKRAAEAVNPSDPSNPDPDLDDDSGDTAPSDKTCLSEAGSLGWIACPTGDSMESFTETAYEKMVEDYLKVEPELLGNGDASTEGAWSLFRNLANVGFVVLLLAIVFSQLTGVGIDNYGIKKTLPKIIVTALLVNLSYVICQAIVDVSNIVGNSGRELLDTIASTIAGGSGVPGMGGMIAGIAGALGIGSAAVASITILSGGIWALLLPLLLGLLSAIISIFFAFFLLAARKALVILLVVVSPIAFLLYALPNTKKIFDKWFKVFKAMVLLYPICGFIMGGGTLAATIILNGTSVAASDINDSTKFFLVLSALAIKIIPIFFIPTLLKGAFAALGSVGAKLSGIGKSLGGKATTGIRKSEGYQNAKIRSAAVKEGSIRDKLSRTAFGKKTGLSTRIARSNLAAAQLREKQGDLSKWNDEDYRKNRAAALEEKEFDESVKNAEAALRNGTFEYVDENGNTQTVSSNSQALDSNGDLGDLGKAFRQSLVRGDSNKAMALYNTLKGTDAGRQAIITALDKGGLDMDNAATARVVNSIANDTSYKKSNRSFSDWAQGMRGKTAANGGVIKENAISSIRADYDKKVAGSLRAEDVKDMDDLEFSALVNAAKNKGARSSAVLSSVRSNSQIFDGLKQKQREQINDALGGISTNDGMTADVDLRPGDNNSGNINNDDGSTFTAGHGDDSTYST